MPAQRNLIRASVGILLLLACHQDRVTSPTGGLRTLSPRPADNAAHPKDSPADITASFSGRNPDNGKTATDSTFGFRVKWTTRYKVTVYD